jgi:hypothetical protein
MLQLNRINNCKGWLTLWFTILTISITFSYAYASDLTELVEKNPKESAPDLGQALDNQGNPITANPKIQISLEFLEQDIPEVSNSETPKSSKRKQPSNKSARTATNKSPRQKIANDPGCRWLDTRMDHLEDQLRSPHNQTLGHQESELKIRQKEWRCLKCAKQGPAQGDHSRCQQKR